MDEEAQRTLYCGNLDSQVTEAMLYELFLQAGPLEKVKVPDGKPFGFITFEHPVSVEYTLKLMDGIRLFNKTLRLQPRTKGPPSRQNSFGSNMHQQQQQNGGNMGPPGVMGRHHPGVMNQSIHRSISAPQFDSFPPGSPGSSRYQRFQEDGDLDRHESSASNQRDRNPERQRDRDNRRDSRGDFGRRERDDNRDRERSYDRHHRGRDTGGPDRDFERDRARNRDHGRDRDDSRDRGSMHRAESYPVLHNEGGFQGQGMRQSRFDQQPAFNEESPIDIELRRQRVMSQLQFFQQMQSMRQQPGGGMGRNDMGGGGMGGGQHHGHRNRGRRY